MKKMGLVWVIIALLVGLYLGYYYEKTKMVKMLTDQRASLQQQINGLKQAAVQPTVTPTVQPAK
jgi:uncharacterized protein YneF (UPF0154 family)